MKYNECEIKDKYGNIVFSPNVVNVDYTPSYNEEGLMVELRCDDDPDYMFRFDYDEHKNLIKESVVETNGTIQSESIYKYNDDGFVVSKTEDYGSDGFFVTEYTYNSDKKLVKILTTENGQETEQIVYEYSNGCLCKKIEGLSNKYICIYDENGKVEKSYTIDEFGKPVKIKRNFLLEFLLKCLLKLLGIKNDV